MASFSVKATYNGQTRKLAFPEICSFPSYDQLHEQLARVFVPGLAFYLSRLIFCPAPGKQILIGMEVHTKADYDRHISPYSGGVFPGAMLKVTVHATPYGRLTNEAPRVGTSTASSAREVALSRPASSNYNPLYIAPTASAPSISPAGIPPPPIIFHTASPRASPTPLTTVRLSPGQLSPLSRTPSSCCEASQKKDEMRDMMSTFLRDLNRIASSTFDVPVEQAAIQAPSTTPQSTRQARDAQTTSGSGRPVARVPIKQTASSAVASESVVHRGIMCDGCRKSVVGPRYKCMKCKDFDLCSRCLEDSDVRSKHSAGHKFFCISLPSDPIHKNVVCDACDLTIAGVRHKCLDCQDYDLCASCIREGALEKHSPFHEFYDIKEPGKVVVHTVYNNGQRSSTRPQPQQGASEASTSPTSVPVPASTSTPQEDVAVYHSAVCNLCDNQIVGARYKCLGCPDFDTCASCFRITPTQHPIHGFVKVKAKEDINVNLSVQPQERHGAWCDSCKKVIVGTRFKCMHPSCPDFDLCMDCEAHPIPVHPAAHPMLKMKTVDTVIPTVYRFGKMDLAPTSAARQIAEDESTKPLPVPSRLPTPQPIIEAPLASPEAPQVDLNLGGDLRSEFSHLLQPVTVQSVVPQAESTLVDVSATPATVCSGLSNEALLVAPTGIETPVSVGFVNDVDAIRRLQENLTSGYSTPDISIIPREAQATMPGGLPEEPLMESSTVWPEMSQKDNVAATVLAVINPVTSADPTPSPSVVAQAPLVAKFVSDLNIADGQIFPPGAEFVKSWILENVGSRAWPEDTQLRFVAGDRMGMESQIVIGAVPANSQATISTPELKAPEKPGRYVAYWRLFDGEGSAFGTSVWIDITVAEVSKDDSESDTSLAASSVIMPRAASGPSADAASAAPLSLASAASTALSEDALSIAGSDMSMVDMPSVHSDDDLWQEASAPAARDMEYVVLFDEGASSEDE